MSKQKKKHPKPQKKQHFEIRNKYQETAAEELLDCYGKPMNAHNNCFNVSEQPYSYKEHVTNKMFYAARRGLLNF